MGLKLSRQAEHDLEKKRLQLHQEEHLRKQQDEIQRRRKDAVKSKLLHEELQRKLRDEARRKQELEAKQRAREREREQKSLQEKQPKKQRTNGNAPTYSRSNKTSHTRPSSSSSSSLSKNPPPPKKSDYSHETLQKLAQTSAPSRRGDRGSDNERSMDKSSGRQAAIEKYRVQRGFSPERVLSSAQSATGSKILTRPPVKRAAAASRNSFPLYKSPGSGVNHVRDAGLKAIRDGPIALNTIKKDRRTIEEVSAELREKDSRRDERAKKVKEIEEERERQRLHREKAIQSAKFTKALMGDDPDETE
ncbi:hypothetical protein BGZ65_012126, partial [Modicella reniformis]